MKSSAKKRIENQLTYLKENRGKLVIDADTHLTDIDNLDSTLKEKMLASPDYYQGRPIDAGDLIKEMKLADVDMCLIWQNPAATIYGEDKDQNFENLLAANQYIYNSALKYPDKFIPAGWTDPKALGIENALKLVDICIQKFGFPIIKMNPAQNQFPIDDEMVVKVVEHIVNQNAAPAFHYGADTVYTPATGLESIANRFPDSPVIAIHMGGGGAGYIEAEALYRESRALGLKHPNIKFILSAKRDTHIESDLITYQLAGAPFKHNLCCASDAPYGRQTWNFGGYRWMFKSLMKGSEHTDVRIQQNPGLFTLEDVQNYMGNNFLNVVIDRYSKLK